MTHPVQHSDLHRDVAHHTIYVKWSQMNAVLDSHVVDFDVAVVRRCDEELRIGREAETADRHSVPCKTSADTLCCRPMTASRQQQ